MCKSFRYNFANKHTDYCKNIKNNQLIRIYRYADSSMTVQTKPKINNQCCLLISEYVCYIKKTKFGFNIKDSLWKINFDFQFPIIIVSK